MARYYEETALIEFVKQYTPTIEGETTLECVERAIRNAPTADVVPKSEEGAECPTCHGTGRIGTTDWLTKNISKEQLAKEKAEAIAEHEQHIKQDYAREIFEEIEKLSYRFMNDEHYIFGDMVWDIAELKKKYTMGD